MNFAIVNIIVYSGSFELEMLCAKKYACDYSVSNVFLNVHEIKYVLQILLRMYKSQINAGTENILCSQFPNGGKLNLL